MTYPRLHVPGERKADETFQPFDIFACWSPAPSARTISCATWNPFARRGLRYGPCHVAFAVTHHEQTLWAESTKSCQHPCLYAGDVVEGCQLHDPWDRIRDYTSAGGRVSLYRLVPLWRLCQNRQNDLTRIVVRDFVAQKVRYDLDGAICSGLRVLKLLDLVVGSGLFPRADLDHLFCSEWAAALAMRLGLLPVGNCSKYTPAGFVRRMVANGVVELHRTFPANRFLWRDCEFPACA